MNRGEALLSIREPVPRSTIGRNQEDTHGSGSTLDKSPDRMESSFGMAALMVGPIRRLIQTDQLVSCWGVTLWSQRDSLLNGYARCSHGNPHLQSGMAHTFGLDP